MLFWTFDEQAAPVFGVPSGFCRTLLMVLLSVVVVTSMRLAGVVLATALLVLPGAIAACLDALHTTSAGLAFTDEEEIDAAGLHLRDGMRRKRTLMDLAMHPRCVHHLAMFRPAYMPPEALALADRCGRGLDWLLRAAAGLRGGAVRVPMLGYQWRRHAAQDSTSDGDVYARALPTLRQMTRSWMRYDAAIPEARP